MRLGELQAHFKVAVNPDDYVQENLKFGLVEVVYEWAKVLVHSSNFNFFLCCIWMGTKGTCFEYFNISDGYQLSFTFGWCGYEIHIVFSALVPYNNLGGKVLFSCSILLCISSFLFTDEQENKIALLLSSSTERITTHSAELFKVLMIWTPSRCNNLSPSIFLCFLI